MPARCMSGWLMKRVVLVRRLLLRLLNVSAIMKRPGDPVQAVHPTGFLAENSEFARTVDQAGLVSSGLPQKPWK